MTAKYILVALTIFAVIAGLGAFKSSEGGGDLGGPMMMGLGMMILSGAAVLGLLTLIGFLAP